MMGLLDLEMDLWNESDIEAGLGIDSWAEADLEADSWAGVVTGCLSEAGGDPEGDQFLIGQA